MQNSNFTLYDGPRSDEWATPDTLFAEVAKYYNFSIDFAASKHNYKVLRHYTAKDNALEQDWGSEEVGWLNPPFSRAAEFFMKAKDANVVAIYKASNLETCLWQDVIFPYSSWVCFIRGRVQYRKSSSRRGVPFGSALIGFNVPNKVEHLGFCVTGGKGEAKSKTKKAAGNS